MLKKLANSNVNLYVRYPNQHLAISLGYAAVALTVASFVARKLDNADTTP